MLQLLDFNENPNVGVYCRTNEDVAFVRKGLSKKVRNILNTVLGVNVVQLSVADATIIGSLLCLNSKGAIVTDFVDYDAVKTIEKNGLNVCIIKDKLNAAGNDILANDNGALVHPDLKDESIVDIKKTLEVPVFRGTIGSLKTVGMAAVVTNQGLLCHPKVSEEEKTQLEKVFGVNVMIGTVNHGSPVIGSGLVANTKGAIIGNLTTGIEMGRIEEALGYLK